MVFTVDRESQKVIATVRHDGESKQYESILSVCNNLVCTCRSVHLELIPIPTVEGNDRPPARPHRVGIDVVERSLARQGNLRTPKEDLGFACSLLSTMDETDYSFLHKRHFEFKNKITENASVDSIDAHFDYGEVERNGLMSAYNDVLPFGDQMLITMNDKQCIVMDQFCLLPKCSCTDTILSIMPIDESGNIGEEIFSFTVAYKKKLWRELESPPSSFSAERIRDVIEAQIPDVYSRLRARHVKLKAIYAHCKKRHFMAKQQPLELPKVGRNDPCPCGSGLKYKKCCERKAG